MIKKTFFIEDLNHQLLAAAGPWSQWQNPEGQAIWSACIITTDVIDSLQQYHSRMPFFLNAEQQQLWLAETAALEEVLPLLEAHTVLNFASNPVFIIKVPRSLQ